MRHGDVSYVDADGRPVDPESVMLTATGRKQVAAAREMLSEIPLDRILCSGLPRTQETASIMATNRGIEIENDERLREIRGGRLSQVSPENREAAFVYGLETAGNAGAAFAGGEEFQVFGDRIISAFEEKLFEDGWQRMLLVAHDVVNRMILSHICGAGLSGLATFEQDMACINVIDVDIIEGQLERTLIKALNVTAYNTSKSGMYQTSFEQVFKTLFDY
ncbi:histidine phosphatase family protein [Aestuariispira insulae]|nr:histidine phosphatase family protein [Aestuariispira insulae]